MIKPESIRKGNLVGLNLKQYPDNLFIISEIGEERAYVNINEDEVNYFKYEDIEGVPLSKEFLKKFKFKWDATYKNYVHAGDRHQVVIQHDGKMIYRIPGSSIREIRYVHDLQNVFWAITGTEL